MNRYCNGNEFERHGKRWGKCFLDGTIFEIPGARPRRCPNCERAWRPSVHDPNYFNPDKSPHVALQADLPHYQRRCEELYNENFALRDGLRGWQDVASRAEEAHAGCAPTVANLERRLREWEERTGCGLPDEAPTKEEIEQARAFRAEVFSGGHKAEEWERLRAERDAAVERDRVTTAIHLEQREVWKDREDELNKLRQQLKQQPVYVEAIKTTARWLAGEGATLVGKHWAVGITPLFVVELLASHLVHALLGRHTPTARDATCSVCGKTEEAVAAAEGPEGPDERVLRLP